MNLPTTVCPFCQGEKKLHNATCTRSQCQEANYYACMLGSAKHGKRRHKLLEAKAMETARIAGKHSVRGALVLLVLTLLAPVARAGELIPMEFAKASSYCSLVKAVPGSPRWQTDEGREKLAACLALGLAYEDGNRLDDAGEVIQRNYLRALDNYVTGCAGGDAFACVSAGQLFEKGLLRMSRGSADQFILTHYKAGCYAPAGGDVGAVALACEVAAQNLTRSGWKLKGRAQAHAYAASTKLYARACELGQDRSCGLKGGGPIQ